MIRPEVFYNDASFDTPKGFYQYDRLGFRCPETNLFLPLFFVIMTGKSYEDYSIIYKEMSRISEDLCGKKLKIPIAKSDMR